MCLCEHQSPLLVVLCQNTHWLLNMCLLTWHRIFSIIFYSWWTAVTAYRLSSLDILQCRITKLANTSILLMITEPLRMRCVRFSKNVTKSLIKILAHFAVLVTTAACLEMLFSKLLSKRQRLSESVCVYRKNVCSITNTYTVFIIMFQIKLYSDKTEMTLTDYSRLSASHDKIDNFKLSQVKSMSY